jgi:hypothetical protein
MGSPRRGHPAREPKPPTGNDFEARLRRSMDACGTRPGAPAVIIDTIEAAGPEARTPHTDMPDCVRCRGATILVRF